MSKTPIQPFIKNKILDKIKINEFQFTEPTEYMLRIIYNHLLTAESEWISVANRIQSNLGKLDTKDMFTGSAYDYIPPEIRNELESSPNIGFISHLNMGERNIHIKIVFPRSDSSTIYKKRAEQMVKRIFLWLSIAEKFACKTCSKEMTIFLYMTDHIKLLPSKGQSIDKINANTAFTSSCSHSTDIHLFRQEEWFKVLIHETFHNLGLDFSTMSQTKVEPVILTMFPLNIPDIRIFESYCETWAELMNIMFSVYWHSKNKSDINKILDKMEDLMQLERTFSLFQCTKVLHNYGLKYTDIYQTATHKANLGKLGNYKEETNAFSYYVLKPILFFHLNEFIEWSIKHNGLTMDFKKTQANVMNYAGLIKRLYNSPEFIDNMEQIAQLYNDNGKFEYKTLRMTVVDPF